MPLIKFEIFFTIQDSSSTFILIKHLYHYIAKKLNPSMPQDYHPTSLCNIVCKMLTKVFINRLKEVFPSLISSEQGAFLSRHHITSTILFAQLMYSIRQALRSRFFMMLTLDIGKAFDHVHWSLLLQVMLKFDFHPIFMNGLNFVFHILILLY